MILLDHDLDNSGFGYSITIVGPRYMDRNKELIVDAYELSLGEFMACGGQPPHNPGSDWTLVDTAETLLQPMSSLFNYG